MRDAAHVLKGTTAVGLALFALMACAPTGAVVKAEDICQPGAYVFCRCEDRNEGTKLCREDGQSFEQCQCPENDEVKDEDTAGEKATAKDNDRDSPPTSGPPAPPEEEDIPLDDDDGGLPPPIRRDAGTSPSKTDAG